MFSDGLFCAHAISFPRLVEDSQWQSWVGGNLLEDQVMDFLKLWADRDLVLRPRASVRPQSRWYPYMCMASRPRRPTRQHLVILPRVTSDDDSTPRAAHLSGRGAPADSPKTKGKDSTTDKNSLPSSKLTACTCTASREHSTSRKRQEFASSVSCEGCSSGACDTAGCCSSSSSSTSSTDAGNGRGEHPWRFCVNMSGCDEVRAVTEGGMLMVEGRGSSDSSHRMMRYITSLPRHVSHDSLTARLSNGCLTVTQKPGAQHLEDQAKTLQIEMQQEQENALKAKEHQEQQKTPGSTELNQQRVVEPTALQQQGKAGEGNKQQKSQSAEPQLTPNLPAGVEEEQSQQTTAA